MTTTAATAANLTLSTLTDDALLAMVLQRDPTAWRELLRRFRHHIFACIEQIASRYQRVLAREDLQEIYSDLWVNLLHDDMRRLRAFDPTRGAKLGTWLGLLSIHTTYDFLRRTQRRPIVCDAELAMDNAPAEDPDALDLVIEKERWSRIMNLLRDLSDRERVFIELYYRHGLEPRQIARRMRISVKTVYAKKHKLGPKLRAVGQAVSREAA